jgi:DNA polymerase-3 subunit epsilon
MDDFVAIDFETANRSRDSACAVGLAVVRAGRITESYSSLIQPPTLEFDQYFIGIHGITPDAVRNAPPFAEVWLEIERRCGDGLVAAHNASFDVGIMSACAGHDDRACLPGRYVCTVELARAMLPGLPNHKLRTLANVFGLPLDHHDAASDAVACAELAIRLFRLAGPDQIEAYCRSFADFGRSSEIEFSGACVSISLEEMGIKLLNDGEEMALIEPADADGRFDGMRFVFTGEMAFLDRAEASQIVAQQGGKATGSVSKKTNIVVVGDEVLDLYKRSGKTTGKLAKAVELQESGAPIRIVSESEFLEMIE